MFYVKSDTKSATVSYKAKLEGILEKNDDPNDSFVLTEMKKRKTAVRQSSRLKDIDVSKLKKVLCFSRACDDTYTHIWKISNFEGIPFAKEYPIYSPSFTMGGSLFQVLLTKHEAKKDIEGKLYVGDEGESDYDEFSDEENDQADSKKEAKDSGKDDGKKEAKESDKGNLESESTPQEQAKDLDQDESALKEQTQDLVSIEPQDGQQNFEAALEEQSNETDVKKPLEEKIFGRLGLRVVKMDDNNTWDVVKYYFLVKSGDIELRTEERVDPGNSDYESRPLYVYLTEEDPKVSELFQKKIVEIECHMTYIYIEGNSQEIPRMYEGKKFADDLRILHKSKKFSDVVLKASGGEEILAHRNVLCARSKGLEKMLNELESKKASKESEDDDSKLQTFDLDLDPEVCEMMINFIYGSDIDNFKLEKCIDLHKAADTYGVTNLRRSVSDYFRKQLDENNICKACLGVCDYTDDCIDVVKKLSSEVLEKVLAKEKCSHMA